jgi:hypothetical protein
VQPVDFGGLMADGRTIQLNTTWISGQPLTLKYAWHDYPTMLVFDALDGRPVAPFNASVVVPA